jgi:predicted ATPase
MAGLPAWRRESARALLIIEESPAFEWVHETEYLCAGFELVDIPAGSVEARAAMIDAHLRSWA